jgi:hypothetical protein
LVRGHPLRGIWPAREGEIESCHLSHGELFE